ncbi:SRPBCC family protein [Halomarina salina]|uniref:SRPBCC family protein n=1 Tax=Halomarina salina TaxID=1872699 RepID=A0ABD5RLK3_9EURY
MNHVETSVDIDAPPEAVWEVLMDVERYEEWNPFMTIEKRPVAGERVTVHLTPPGKPAVTMTPEVLVADGRELRWRGTLGVNGLYDGEHTFTLTERPDGRTRLVHAERFSGVLVRPVNWWLGDSTERGFVQMNEALKARVESRAVA